MSKQDLSGVTTMPTVIRPELSKNNPYYISKNRYYELKYFCLQYREYKQRYNELCSYIKPGWLIKIEENPNYYGTNSITYVRDRYLEKIKVIEDCAKSLDPVLGQYVFMGVTNGVTYSYLKMNNNIPCCKDIYYKLYREFFWILSNKM